MHFQHDIKASLPCPEHFFYAVAPWKTISVSHTYMQGHIHDHFLSHGQDSTEWPVNQIKRPQCFRERECALNNTEIKHGEREWEEECTWGIVRPCESSPQKQKQLWVHSPLRGEISSCTTHPSQHTTITTSPAEISFGCSLAARGAALDTYHVRQVLCLGFLFLKT